MALTEGAVDRQRNHRGEVQRGMRSKVTLRQSLFRVIGIALALTALIFLVQTLSHTHPDGQGQATCQLCQIAQSSMLATASASVPVLTFVPTVPVEQPILLIPKEDLSFAFPARAPPAEILL
jgi:hypothetical protein